MVTSGAASPVWAQSDVRRAGSSESAPAQGTRTVSGTVLDETGQPLIGATVTAVDAGSGRTLKGGYTDASGKFTLEVPAGTAIRIRVSYVGYAERVVNLADNQNTVSITMAESSSEFEEVLITGFQPITKGDNAGAMQKIDGAKLENVPMPSVTNMLQGRIAGGQVLQTNGIPGSATRIRLRGQSTIGSAGQPLFIVDGVPVFNDDPSDRNFNENPSHATNMDPLSTIPAADIERIDILQDGYSTAIYGSRAANGVVIITTKSGQSGKTSFRANYSAGFAEPTRILPLLSGPEWTALRGELYFNQNGAPMPANFDVHPNGNINIPASQAAVTNTNWFDALFRNGLVQDFSLSANGGNEKTRFYSGINYHENEGFLAGARYRRFGVRFNLENQATERVKIGARFSINRETNDQVRESYTGGIGSVQRGDALNIMPIFNPDGTYFGSQAVDPNTVNINPVAVLNNSSYTTSNWRILGGVFTDVKITDNISLYTDFGVDLNNGSNLGVRGGPLRWVQRQQVMSGMVTPVGPFFQSGTFNERRFEWFNWNFKSYLTWRPKLGDQHQLSVVGGMEAFETRFSFATIYTQGNAGFIDPFFNNFSGGLNQNITGVPVFLPAMGGYNGGLDSRSTFLSFYARGDYKLKERYILGLSLRADGSSRFGANNRWGFFPAISAGWLIHKDPSINLPDWVNFLKVKGSFGMNGNAEFPNLLWASTYSGAGGYQGVPGSQPTRLANPDLRWEATQKFNFGLEFEVLGGRLSGTIDFYYNRSSDLILVTKTQASSGYNEVAANLSDVVVRNRGVDIALQGTILPALNRKDIGWRAGVNLGFLQNKVLSTGGRAPDGFQQGPGDARVVEGQPVGVPFLVRHAYVDPATGDEYFFDLNGNPVRGPISGNLLQFRQAAGSPFPWLSGGLDNTISWNGFELQMLWTFQVGNTVYDDGAKYQIGDLAGSNQRREILNRWNAPGQITNVPRLGFITDFDANNSTRFLFDADFLRLRQLTLAYNFAPSICEKLKLTSLRVFATGVNLLVFTNFPGWDPEVVRYSPSGDQGPRLQDQNVSFAAPYLATPQARTYTFGVNIGF